MKPELRKQLDVRLRRIAGQVAGIQRMVEEDRYCVDVLLQIAAVRAALEQVGKRLLAAHVETCVADAFASGSARERRRKMDELLEVFGRFGAVDGGSKAPR
jgi:DNA-binding FrmR family transcriptional regulator